MQTTHSHAAPYIREALVRAVNSARNSRTQRDRAAGFALAHGLARALRIMATSADQTPVEGIADEEGLGTGWIDAAREWVGHDADLIFGTAPAPVARVDVPPVPLPKIPTSRRTRRAFRRGGKVAHVIVGAGDEHVGDAFTTECGVARAEVADTVAEPGQVDLCKRCCKALGWFVRPLP